MKKYWAIALYKIDFGIWGYFEHIGIWGYFEHIKMNEAWRQKGRIQNKLQRYLDKGVETNIIMREDMILLHLKDGKFIVDTRPIERYLKQHTTTEWYNENTRVTMTEGI